MKSVAIQEIFASIQGEGPWVGERHIFVRFMGCDLRCVYCDTPAAVQIETDDRTGNPCRVQTAAGVNGYDKVPNPVSSADLTEFCSRLIIPGPSRPTLSLTGGEPLLQCSFLVEWLPLVKQRFRIYLETSGIHANAMLRLRDMVDVVSMDFKLPSATGLRPFWEEHNEFLSAARGRSIVVKAVVTKNTTREDLLTAARILADFDTSIPLVIQPAGGQFAPESSMLMAFQDAALRIIEHVRVIPQTHKILNVL